MSTTPLAEHYNPDPLLDPPAPLEPLGITSPEIYRHLALDLANICPLRAQLMEELRQAHESLSKELEQERGEILYLIGFSLNNYEVIHSSIPENVAVEHQNSPDKTFKIVEAQTKPINEVVPIGCLHPARDETVTQICSSEGLENLDIVVAASISGSIQDRKATAASGKQRHASAPDTDLSKQDEDNLSLAYTLSEGLIFAEHAFRKQPSRAQSFRHIIDTILNSVNI
jgi:hypothetical protein